MEAPDKELEVFSAILLHQYIRLTVAAIYHQSGGEQKSCCFIISPENYEKMMAEPLQTALLNLALEYNAADQLLTVTPNQDFIEQYQNAIMEDVAAKFFNNYRHRYDKFIRLSEA